MNLLKRLQSFIPENRVNIFGKKSLIDSTLPYYFLPVYLIVLFGLQMIFHNPFIIIFATYALIPLTDQIFSLDQRNPTKQQVKQLQADNFYFQLPIYLTIIIDWALFIYALNIFHNFEISFHNFHVLFAYIFIFFNLNAAQFAVAHQIMHKSTIRKVIGTIHMLKTLNMHFTYEHLYGHHRKVATPEDPASAQKNDNVYLFFVKSHFGSYKSVYLMEKQIGKSFWNNLLVLSIVCSISFIGLIFIFFGVQATICFLLCALGAVFYLQAINYIQHYGLRRKKLENGEYEKVTVKHSWNSAHRFSNYLFFKLQRHSDHHQNSKKPYQILLSIKQSAQLPHGYIIMTAMSLFPQIWFKIMNPLVEQYNKQVFSQQKTEIVMKKAKIQTRLFVLQLSLTFFIVLLCTIFMQN